MRTALRLVWKQYRFELASMVIAIGLLIIMTLVVEARLNDVRPTGACLEFWSTSAENGPGCPNLRPFFDRQQEAGNLVGALMFLPLVAGALLGSVLVSREVEHRTAQLGWSLSGSRRRWLAERVLPVGVLLAIMLAGVAITSESLEGARAPSVDPRASLEGFGYRWFPVVTRGLAVFSAALLVGAVVARQLPAVILSIGVALVVWFVLGVAFPFGAPTRWIDQDSGDGATGSEGDRWIRSGLRSTDGRFVSWYQAQDEGRRIQPECQQSDITDDCVHARDGWIRRNYTPVAEIVSGHQLTEIEQREALVLGVFAVLALGASVLVVQRRRPY